MDVFTCSNTAVWAHALQPIGLALVTGILALLAKRQRDVKRTVEDVREQQTSAEVVAQALRRRLDEGD